MKAAMHKYRKEVTRDASATDSGTDDDDRPLATSSSPAKHQARNGVNGKSSGAEPMSEDEPATVRTRYCPQLFMLIVQWQT